MIEGCFDDEGPLIERKMAALTKHIILPPGLRPFKQNLIAVFLKKSLFIDFLKRCAMAAAIFECNHDCLHPWYCCSVPWLSWLVHHWLSFNEASPCWFLDCSFYYWINANGADLATIFCQVAADWAINRICIGPQKYPLLLN